MLTTVVLAATLLFSTAAPSMAAGGAVTHDQAFVTAAYADFLDRSPSQSEMAAATAVPLTTTSARSAVVTGLSTSSEWISHTVDKLYSDTLGRPADAGGKAYWAQKLQSHAMTVAQVAANFYSSKEYFNGIGGGTNTSWVTDLYSKILLRPVDQSGLNYWVPATARHGRWWVAYSFYQSSESCHTRVKTLYQELLHRAPDAGGWDYWAGQVRKSGDLVLAAKLASSSEYYNDAWDRFGSTVTVPGAPTNVVAAAGDGQVSVSWSAPSADGGAAISGYVVTSSPGAKTCSTSGGLGCTVTGLTNGTAYTFTVRASNSAGEGPASAASNSVTPAAAASWQQLATTNSPSDWAPTAMNTSGEIVGAVTRFAVACAAPCTSPSMLDVPVNITEVHVTGVSDTGEIVGYGYTDQGTEEGLVWSSVSASPTVLADPTGATMVEVDGVSPEGTIYGADVSGSAGVNSWALVWTSASSAPTTLALPTGYTYSTVAAISASGTIYGNARDTNGKTHGLIWSSPSATPTVMATPTGSVFCAIGGVTSSGSIAGTCSDVYRVTTAMIWSSPTATPTPLPLPADPSYFQSGVTKMGPAGVIIGFGTRKVDNVDITESTAWSSPTATPVVLEDMNGPSGEAIPTGISPAGVIVGWGIDPVTDAEQGLTWTFPGLTPTPIAQASLPLMTVQTTAISSSGTIVGNGTDPNGITHALVWASSTATPGLLSVPTGYDDSAAAGITDTGVIFGSATGPDGNVHGLVWSSATASPTVLVVPSGYTNASLAGITSTGEIVGTGTDTSSGEQVTHGLVWASTSATPTVLDDSSTYTDITVAGVSSAGTIIANAELSSDTSQGVVLVWTSPSATPTLLAMPTGYRCWYTCVATESSTGQIAARVMNGSYFGMVWSSPTAPGAVLDGSTGVSNLSTSSPNGHVVGVTGTGSLLSWASPSAPAFTVAPPTGVTLGMSGDGIAVNDAGQITATSGQAAYVYTP